jgi:transposase
MAGDPEGFAAQKHGVCLFGFMELGRHAGAHPLRALCKMPRAGGTGSEPHSRHHR